MFHRVRVQSFRLPSPPLSAGVVTFTVLLSVFRYFLTLLDVFLPCTFAPRLRADVLSLVSCMVRSVHIGGADKLLVLLAGAVRQPSSHQYSAHHGARPPSHVTGG